MPKPTRIWTDVDYEKPGKQVGWLNLHHSVTRSAYGNIMIPIAVVAAAAARPRCSWPATTATSTRARSRSAS